MLSVTLDSLYFPILGYYYFFHGYLSLSESRLLVMLLHLLHIFFNISFKEILSGSFLSDISSEHVVTFNKLDFPLGLFQILLDGGS